MLYTRASPIRGVPSSLYFNRDLKWSLVHTSLQNLEKRDVDVAYEWKLSKEKKLLGHVCVILYVLFLCYIKGISNKRCTAFS